jgi:non-specific serine/threonine protein kinase
MHITLSFYPAVSGINLRPFALAMMREHNSPPWHLAYAFINLAQSLRDLGDTAAERARLEEVLALRPHLGEGDATAQALGYLGRISLQQGDRPEARRYLGDALGIYRRLGSKRGAAWTLSSMAQIALAEEHAARAARLLGAAQALFEDFGALPAEVALHSTAAAIRAALGGRAFAAAWAEGQAMSLEDAIAYALAEPSPGEAA